MCVKAILAIRNYGILYALPRMWWQCGSQNRMDDIIMSKSQGVAVVTAGVLPTMYNVDNL